MDHAEMINNKVSLKGTIVGQPTYSHEVFGEGFYETNIKVKRLSEQVDVLPMTVSERLVAKIGLAEGKEIAVKGQFRSYNKVDAERSRLMLTVFAREISEPCESDVPNLIEITGYICKPPLYRTTPFKREICDVLIAVNRAYNKSDYIPCIAWGRNARYVSTLAVGERIHLEGRVQSREYQKQLPSGDVVVRTAYEVSVTKLSVLDENEPELEEFAALCP
jgi:primosomal replication protein N